VRYPDPAPHLRVRLHGNPARLATHAGPALFAALADAVEAGLAIRVEVDTYQREVERYGGVAAMEAAEALFHADSEAVAEVVRACAGDGGADARQRLAPLGVHLLLDDFGVDTVARRALLERAGAASGEERRALGAHYRAVRASLDALLGGAAVSEPLAAGAEAMRARSRAAAPAVSELLRLEREGELDEPLDRLLLHYTHMHLNRLFREDAPRHERRCYHILARHYASRLARSPGTRAADGGG
jgi:thiopeptide-type bacteriocin biosynthesis protein